jgi:hypothetical protein
MDRGRFAPTKPAAKYELILTKIGQALAEHHAVSRTPLARGLRVINTDNATVGMRYMMAPPML